jgi:hypothetical protein
VKPCEDHAAQQLPLAIIKIDNRRLEVQRCTYTEATRQTLSHIESTCANIVLAVSSIITALIFGYYFYHYVWTGTRQFINWRGAVVYMISPGSLSLFFVTSLGLHRSCKIKIAVSSLTLSALLLGLEGFLRTKTASVDPPFWGVDKASDGKKKIIAQLAEQARISFDLRDRVKVSDELRQRGIDAVPAVMIASLYENGGRKFSEYTNGTEIIPIGAISKKTTILCNETGEYVTYDSDEHGFRNPTGIWKSVRADVAAIGQSFVQGYCVSDGKNFVDIIRKYYPVTLNLGRSGESPLLQLGAVKEYLPRYAPKAVLWFFCEDIDLYDLYFQAKHSLLKRYLDANFTQHLFDRQEEIDRALGGFATDLEKNDRQPKRSLAEHSSLVNKFLEVIKLPNLRRNLDLAYGVSKEDNEYLSSLQSERAIWDAFRSSLLHARTSIANWGGSLYFVYLPSWGRFAKGSSVSDQHTRVLNVVSNLGIPIIDLVPVFQAQKDPLSLFPFRVFGHYNEFGNQIVGDNVLKFLSARQQIAPLQP